MKQGYRLIAGLGAMVWAGSFSIAWGAEREYWITAEKVEWNYAPGANKQGHANHGMGVWGENLVYRKYRYIQYTDATFSHAVEQPAWMGVLGPQLRGIEGDVLKIHFLNRADKPFSMHTHGLRYDKNSEGADGGSAGAAVPPGGGFTYIWRLDAGAAPGPQDPSSIVWVYHSHVHEIDDIYDGLVGGIIVTRKDMARGPDDPRPRDVDVEFTTLFMIFDENGRGKTELREEKREYSEGKAHHGPAAVEEGDKKHAINGYIFDRLPGLTVKRGQRVRWHLIDLGSEEDIHTVHWHGETVLDHGRRTDVVELLPASMNSVDMTADNPGRWLLHCHVADHMMAGMMAHWEVEP